MGKDDEQTQNPRSVPSTAPGRDDVTEAPNSDGKDPVSDADTTQALNYFCSIHPGNQTPLERDFGEALLLLQDSLGKKLICLANGEPFPEIDRKVVWPLLDCKPDLAKGEPVALLIDSGGGNADSTYRFARFLQKHCGGYTAVVPRYAKSAATLLALGATEIMMGPSAELGPLDVQIIDPEREESFSGLDEVQSLERLVAFSMEVLDASMMLLVRRSGKKIATILPHVLKFTADTVRPLFENVDTNRYTQMSRALKIGTSYAERLMTDGLGEDAAKNIANKLVESYPSHSFVIDDAEASRLGLNVTAFADEELADRIEKHLRSLLAIGLLRSSVEEGGNKNGDGNESAEGPRCSDTA